MHAEARAWVAAHAPAGKVERVLELGSLYINGGVRDLFDTHTYVGVDLVDGPGVDVVADAAEYSENDPFDVVVCCEVLEHAPNWRGIIAAAGRNCRLGGLFIVTAAGRGRLAHSGFDGGPLRDGEHYDNIELGELKKMMGRWFEVTEARYDAKAKDVYAVGVRK